MTKWYFREENGLSVQPPSAKTGEDSYTINFEATSGEKNRWHTQVGGQVVYPDRAEEDKKLLTYTSAPLDADMEITGYPIVSLAITSTHTDGAFYVYLEDVDENGKVTYLTEGELRALHRKISSEPSPLKILVPYHSFKQKDAQPLIPKPARRAEVWAPTDFSPDQEGHRLRVAVAGHDKGTFIRVPVEGNPVVTMKRNAAARSWIELPIVGTRMNTR
jgi:putative CocE/NonD family hydrolase